MVVVVRTPIVPIEYPATCKRRDLASLCKQLQIPVDSAEADAGNLLPDFGIDLVRRGMTVHTAYDMQNSLPLSGIPHNVSLIIIVINMTPSLGVVKSESARESAQP